MSVHHQSRLTRARTLIPRLAVVALVAGSAMVLTAGPTATAQVSPAAVQLGTAADYAVLAATTVTNTGPSIISGNVGVSPGTAVTGFPPGIVNDGVVHAADAEALQAQADLTTAYTDASARSMTESVSADLAGRTLVGGVYTGGALGLTGALTLDGQNDPDAVFVFQAASTLTVAPSSTVNLINGANPCNVFWQIGSSTTLGTDSDFVGTILALASITIDTGATVEGRALARTGAVTLDNNVVTLPDCLVTAPETTTTTTASATTTPATTTPTTTPVSTTPEATTPVTTSPAPVTTSTPTDVTLPSTGPGSLVTQSGAGFAVMLIGLAALVVARRRQPA